MVLIDVRTSAEYKQGHLKDAILIEYQLIDQLIEKQVTDKSQKIGLYCAAGIRSGIAQQVLLHLGYENAVNLGGYLSLKEEFPYVEP